jgi:hypothetical protein
MRRCVRRRRGGLVQAQVAQVGFAQIEFDAVAGRRPITGGAAHLHRGCHDMAQPGQSFKH